MLEKPSARAQLRAFFEFDDIIERPVFVVLLVIAQYVLVAVVFTKAMEWDREGRPPVFGMNYMEAALMALATMVAAALAIFLLLLLYKLIIRVLRNQKRTRLEDTAREILKTDYKRALRAILKASGVRPSELRNVRSSDIPTLEMQLFTEKEIADFMGPLRQQTFRAVTPYGHGAIYQPVGANRMHGWNYFEGFYTPFYMVCLFLTPSHYVVGEAVCNCMTGQLRQRVRKVKKADIQSVEFRHKTVSYPVTSAMMDRWVENRRADESEMRRISEMMQTHEREVRNARRFNHAPPALPFSMVQNIRFLEITLKDGASLQLNTKIEQTIVRTDHSLSHLVADPFEAPDDGSDWDDISFRVRSFNPYAQGFLDAPPSMDTVAKVRALWSSGRQASSRSFAAYPNFFLTLISGVVLSTAVLWLMNSLTTDTSQRRSSSEEIGYEILTSDGVIPVRSSGNVLSSALELDYQADTALTFACTTDRTRLRQSASSRAVELAALTAGTPLLVRPRTSATPDGWSEVLVVDNGDVVRGFLPDILIDVRPRPARTNCAR